MQIGFIGLGRMGKNMVTRLLDHGHQIVVYNRSVEPMQEVAKLGATTSTSVEDLVQKLAGPRIVWSMLPAGEVTETMLNQLADLLQPGDIVLEGGNSMYKDSMRRAKKFVDLGIKYLDVGVSGGIWGLKEGYCIMVGGDKDAFVKTEPLYASLTEKDGYAYIAGSGSGHFVKMVHNGIEYAMLQAYAEGFDIMHAEKNWDIDLEPVCKLWNHGSVVRSWLLELAESAFHDDANLERIKGYVEDSGEGRWTVLNAIENSVPAPTITLALMERFHSRRPESFAAKVIAALRNKFGGHKTF